jgi:acyl-CoA thioesterase II
VPGTPGPANSFGHLLELAAHGPDTYVGTGPTYPWDGLYGGQVVAQALKAAKMTINGDFAPNSLHAYFLRVGDPEEPVRFEVERLRDGRSFVARQVVARQSTGAILNMAASFQVEGVATMDVQVGAAPSVPGPEAGEEVSWSPLFEMRLVHGSYQARGTGAQTATAWFRMPGPLGTELTVHAAALAYGSDSGPAWLVEAVHQARGGPMEPWRPISLDHAMWFHRPFRADEWLLFDASAASVHGSRGLATGHVYSHEGVLVATVAQEAFLRRPRAQPAG